MRQRSLWGLLKRANRAKEVIQCLKTTDQWLDLTLAYLQIKPLNYPYLFKTRKGQQIKLNHDHDLVTVWVIFFRHEYPVPPKAQLIIDAGANIGTFSIFAHQFAPQKIIALEPFPETLKELQSNLKLNNLDQIVEVRPLALADKSGERNMDLSEGPSQSRGLLQESDSQGLSVQTTTLSDLLNSHSGSVDLLKIDIEGGEHEVFLSTPPQNLSKIQNIAMEYHPNQPKKPLFDYLEQAQFHLKQDFKVGPNSGVAFFSRR